VRPLWLRAFANAVLALAAADASLSLLDELLRAAGDGGWLAAPRNALADLALAGLALTVPAMLATPRMPVPVFLPLAIVTFWLTLGAAPLPLWVASPVALELVGCALQLAAVAVAFALVRAGNGGRGIWFADATPEQPAFAWRHSLAFGAGLVVLGPVVALGYGALAISTEIEVVSHGFVQVGLGGVSLADRHYRRGDREIRLVGMMHIGDPAQYRALTRSFAQASTIVLAEGVSDRDGRLAGKLQYGHAAQAIGLSQQQDLSSYLVSGQPGETPEWPVVRRADVDASAFSPDTIALIEWAGEVWAAEDLASALRMILRGMREQGPERSRAFFADVVDLRNANLEREITRALPDYEHVVVPWGALHLPGIERTLLSWGFAETSREIHPLFAWSTVAAALF
jgi:hypothetical protein